MVVVSNTKHLRSRWMTRGGCAAGLAERQSPSSVEEAAKAQLFTLFLHDEASLESTTANDRREIDFTTTGQS